MKRKLLLLTALVVSALTGMRAQTDVTSTYLTNAAFEASTATTSDVRGYGKDMVSGDVYGFQPVDGWTSVVVNGDNSDSNYPNSGMGAAVFAYGSTNQLKGGNKTAPGEGPETGAANALGFFGVWGCGGYYYQDVTFPAGEYTINIPVYNQSGTNATTSYFGFYPTSGTVQTIATPTSSGSWTTLTKTFTLVAETTGQIRVGYKSNGSGSGANPHLFIDKVQILYKAAVVKDVLANALAAATEANASLSDSDLAAAIATAQSVYDSATASQEDVNAAAETLNAAVMLAMSAARDATFLLENPGFESCTVKTDNAAAGGSAAPLAIDGEWTQLQSAAWSSSAVVEYGGNGQVNGASAPSADNAGEGGKTLGVSVGWGGTVIYKSGTITLPAGSYKLIINGYNNLSGVTQFKSMNGFVATSGSSYMSTKTAFTYATWEKDEITFELAEATEGYIQVGGQAISGGSGSNAKVFFDNVTLEYSSFLDGARDAWLEAHGAAENASTDSKYANVTGNERDALDTEIAKKEPTTVEGYKEATEALKDALSAFVAAVNSYDAYVAEKANAARISNTITVDEPTTAEAAENAVKTLLVNEYNYVKDNFNADAAVEYGMTIDKWTASATSGGNSDTPQTNSNQKWGDTAATYYEQGKNGWGSNAWTLNYSKSVTLPAGTYVLKVAARASNGTTAMLKATIGEEVITETLPNASASGKGITTSGVASFGDGEFANSGNGYGWQWRYLAVTLDEEKEVKFEIDASANTTQQWCSFGDVSFISNVSLDELETAYSNFEMKTLGFDEGEYAPYANADILQAYEAAKAIVENGETPSSQAAVNAIIANMTKDWTVNESDVEAVYNGDFHFGNPNSAEILPYGWTRTNSWGQFQTEVDNASTSNGTAYYNQGGSLQYGNAGIYTMPLNANTVYNLKFKHAKWDGDYNLKVSVLNTAEGMAEVAYTGSTKKCTEENGFLAEEILFVTGAEGDYILTIANSTNAVITDVSITKAENQTLTFTDGQAVPNYAPGTYPNVKIDRKLTAGRWVTAVYPFAISGVEDLTIANATSVVDGVVKFTHVDASEANKPFFMISEDGKSSIELENVEVAAAASTDFEGEGVTTVGSYAMKTFLAVEEGKTKYVLQSNKLNYVGANETWVDTYRAYLVVPASATGEVKQLSIAFDGDEATGISGFAVEKLLDGTIYDLSGRVVKNPSRGLYIINGKKVMVR